MTTDRNTDMEEKDANSLAQEFDGVQFSPQLSVALKDFIAKNLPKRANSGTVTVPAGSTSYAIPHGLNGTPTLISVSDSPLLSGGVILQVNVTQTGVVADGTNIYVDSTGSSPRLAYWAAAII